MNLEGIAQVPAKVETGRVTPIFVVGINRSGTKWISNLLSLHPEIISVQSKRHFGVLETNIFTAFPERFDLQWQEDYVGLIELWSRTDFFRETGIDKELFYSQSPRPKTYGELFRKLMEEYARQNDCRFWLQKLSPYRAWHALKSFPDAKVIFITRDVIQTLKSARKLGLNHGLRPSLARLILSHAMQDGLRRGLQREKTNSLAITYEGLREAPDQVVKKAYEYIGLSGVANATTPFAANTSFHESVSENHNFAFLHRVAIKGFTSVGKRVPVWLMLWLHRRRKTFPEKMVEGTFAEVRDTFRTKANNCVSA